MVEGINVEKIDGENPTLVFIHGWCDSIRGWDLVKEELDLDNRKIFYDQRCHGESVRSEFTINDLADDLENILDEEGVEKPVLVGHSMGGMVALKYAEKYGGLTGLLLLGTSMDTPEPDDRSVKYFLDHLESGNREEWASEIVGNYTSKETPQVFKDSAKKNLAESDEDVLRYGLEAMIDYKVCPKFVDCPALVVGGRNDSAIKPQIIEKLARGLDSEKRILDCSHLILSQRPEQVASILEEFIEDFL